jgi:fibronectin type 3 domain-containing protein
MDLCSFTEILYVHHAELDEKNLLKFFFNSIGISISTFLATALTTFSPAALTAEVTLVWDAPVGAYADSYSVYYGLSSRSYSHKVFVDGQTRYTLTGLDGGETYYIAVTARRGASSAESDFSNEVSVKIPVDDSDKDGMPDSFETANGFDPLDATDARSDSDRDGLTNLEEYRVGRNPMVNEGAVFQIIKSLLLD